MAGTLILSALLIACGGGDDDGSGVCELCSNSIDTCMAVCEGEECDSCRPCSGDLACDGFGGTFNFRCVIDPFEEDTCCDGDRRVDCDTGEPI